MEKRENFSRKRMSILTVVQETDVHPTAEWVHEKLRPRYPDLSLGTVYRNLRKFCETGKVMSLGVINGQEHFDGNTHPHAHFVCEHCGSVMDMPGAVGGLSKEQLTELSQSAGCEIHSWSVCFKGVCPKCRKVRQ